MIEGEFIGMLVSSASVLIGLFFVVHKPLNENTKAMTTLTVKVDQLTEQIRKQEDDFSQYKDHVSESQRRQWDAINENADLILKHSMILEQMKGVKA